MSSIRDKAAEREAEEQYGKDVAWLLSLSGKINKIKPDTEEFRNRKWIEDNYDKILHYKTLIKNN